MAPKDRAPTLEEGVRRVQEAVGRALAAQAVQLERWAAGETREQRRERERMERQRQKKEERLEKLRERSPETGAIMLVAAGVLVVMLFILPMLWWLIFVALGLAIGGVSQLGAKGEIAKLERELGLAPDPEAERAKAEAADPTLARLRRVDELAALLKKEFTEGPEAMRALVARPTETVESIRQGCHALAEREKALRALAKDGTARVEKDRASLSARRDAETDAVTRERLSAALAAMDAQLAQQKELESQANRLEAEQVRLSWTLEGLYTQVVKSRASTGPGGMAPLEDAQLRRELERLTEEVGAVAQALEEVSADPLGPGPTRTRTR